MNDVEVTRVYEVVVYLYEGRDISEGVFSTREKAEDRLKEIKEEWANGPNVEAASIAERIVY